MSLSIQLRLEDLTLSLTLIEMFTQPVDLLLLRVKLNSVPLINVFLDFHPQNVGVNRHTNFIGQGLDFFLFLFNRTAHVVESLLG